MTQNAFEKLTEKYGRCEADPVVNHQEQEEPDRHPKETGSILRPLNRQDKHHDQTEHHPILERWQDSEPVVMLSAFLKEYNDQGFFLQQTREGKPFLNFNPGLKDSEQDPARWDLALHAAHLMDQARKDLDHLIFIGALTLPEYRGVWL
ncbi:hypothetical protein [Desulfobacula phenolica]|uniref:Uncharacterized protein n=1 Tax=Desulfobacula phenolica TaxID=90732 RepID=A0A1H2I3Q8_9BACT|nr:hypothetical protein [Desulfobacula phenolica]SDU38699.1 hypothetical protein SAMN04487931_107215 [Desulfobacula phenolica]